jgi:mono/diheme cytochrome c family protein
MSSLPIDFDLSADGKSIALLSLGGGSTRVGRNQIAFMSRDVLYQDTGGCSPPPPPPIEPPIEYRPPTGDPIAVAIDMRGRLVVQTREPARVEILTHRGGSIKLSDDSHADTGHRIFHMATTLGMACASCHPEGGDDGRVWRFAKIGARRTQSLRGGIGMTAPFHWDGNMRDLSMLMSEVFTTRMRGPKLDAVQVNALAGWLEHVPMVPPSPASDTGAVLRGAVLFNDVTVGCATCHKGGHLTDNTTRSVGTGPLMQVPGLRGVAFRAPYMHDGCAKTLMDRFDGSCGGGDKHGLTSQLTRPQLQDLVAYLESL